MHTVSLRSTMTTAVFGLLLVQLQSADAFATPQILPRTKAAAAAAAPTTTTHAEGMTTTQLNAWSLPATNKFGTFSTTWYDVKDPTGRKIVYNDAVDQ
jgi:hypothetical protein